MTKDFPDFLKESAGCLRMHGCNNLEQAFRGHGIMGYLLRRIRDWEALARQARHKAAALAGLCGCSLRHLERFFGDERGCCPQGWLVGTRLRHAVELLREGKTNKEVAPEVGFAHAANLCRFFRKTTGLSPARYLRNLDRNGTDRSVIPSMLLPDHRHLVWHPDI